MKRPVVWFLLYLIIGILAGRYFSNSIVLFLVFIIVTSVLLYINLGTKLFLITPVFSLIGFLLIVNSLNINNQSLESLIDLNSKNNSIVNGKVVSISETQSGNYKIRIKANYFIIDEKEIKDTIFLEAISKKNKGINVDGNVVVEGNLQKLDTARNPGGYNEYIYLKTQRVEYKMFVENIEQVNFKPFINSFFYNTRAKMGDIFERSLPKNEAGIMKAVILGNKSGIDDETSELYRNAGIYHVLVVSGLHISIVTLLFRTLLSKILNKRLASIVSLCFLVFYVILTGASPSTVRAAIMAGTVILGDIIYRDSEMINSVALSAFLIILYQPLYLWHIGFLYSYSSVLGLIILFPALDKAVVLLCSKVKKLDFILKYKVVRFALLSSTSVFLATIPINTYYFYNASIITIFINAVIVPTICVLVIGGFIVCILGFFSITISSFIAVVCSFMIKLYEIVCRIGVSIHFGSMLTGRPSIIFLIIYIVLLISFCYALSDNEKIFKQRKIYLVLSSLIFIGLNISLLIFPQKLFVTMLDVGQGDSIVITKDTSCFIVDGGGNSRKDIGDNTGTFVILPYLNYKKISVVDGVFVSHIDSDHTIGIIEVLMKKKVKTLYLSPNSIDESDELYQKLISVAKDKGVRIAYIDTSFKIIDNHNFTISCIHPGEFNSNDKNNNSLVLKLSYGEADILLTGDIGFEAEDYLVENNININSEILKVAHHGSKYSTSQEFIDNVQPKYAIISSGINNLYSHPSDEVITLLEENNIKYYNTAKNGAITIKTDGEIIEIQTMIK